MEAVEVSSGPLEVAGRGRLKAVGDCGPWISRPLETVDGEP